MIHAKNYETVSKFVKVMPKILWSLFSGHGVYCLVMKQCKIKEKKFQQEENFSTH